MQLILKDLPKISLNLWYSGTHWSKRKEIKDNYHWLIKSQFKHVFSKDKQYEVDYVFYFKGAPLDVTNCAAMVKLIEDIIFQDDNWKIINKITISSRKAKNKQRVEINVTEIN
ncbi:hypothetical protein KAR91_25755 [Candidatus Pacearchaeota archaeon]|nr:hypothetical protein [Candidatus Pacearchaeota archaeon]